MPKVEERLKKLDSLKLAPEVTTEGRRLLTRMPKLKSRAGPAEGVPAAVRRHAGARTRS